MPTVSAEVRTINMMNKTITLGEVHPPDNGLLEEGDKLAWNTNESYVEPNKAYTVYTKDCLEAEGMQFRGSLPSYTGYIGFEAVQNTMLKARESEV